MGESRQQRQQKHDLNTAARLLTGFPLKALLELEIFSLFAVETQIVFLLLHLSKSSLPRRAQLSSSRRLSYT